MLCGRGKVFAYIFNGNGINTKTHLSAENDRQIEKDTLRHILSYPSERIKKGTYGRTGTVTAEMCHNSKICTSDRILYYTILYDTIRYDTTRWYWEGYDWE